MTTIHTELAGIEAANNAADLPIQVSIQHGATWQNMSWDGLVADHRQHAPPSHRHRCLRVTLGMSVRFLMLTATIAVVPANRAIANIPDAQTVGDSLAPNH